MAQAEVLRPEDATPVAGVAVMGTMPHRVRLGAADRAISHRGRHVGCVVEIVTPGSGARTARNSDARISFGSSTAC